MLRSQPVHDGLNDALEQVGGRAHAEADDPSEVEGFTGAGRDDDLAWASAVLKSAGKSDSDQAPWLEDVARVLSRQRRGDFADTSDHDHEAAAFPDRESRPDALRPRHPAHQSVGFLLEGRDHG